MTRSAVTSDRRPRLASLDVFRGLVMLLLIPDASGGFSFYTMAARGPESSLWSWLARLFTHAQWSGGTIWDLVMPAFLFMIGVAVPYSYAAVVTTDQGVCESAYDADIKRVAGTPTACRALTLARGSDFWIVPAVNLPAGSYWGARNRARCEEVERLQARDSGLSTRGCQTVRVEFR